MENDEIVLITNKEEFIEAIRSGETSFEHFVSDRDEYGSVDSMWQDYYRRRFAISNLRFGAKFRDEVIMPLLQDDTDFKIDGILYKLVIEEYTEKQKCDTGYTKKIWENGFEYEPIYVDNEVVVCSEIVVERVKRKTINLTKKKSN